MEFKGIKRAEEYCNSIEERNPYEDYLNGYNQALEDSKYTEMLEMLQRAKDKLYTVQSPSTSCRMLGDEIEQLIKESTEL